MRLFGSKSLRVNLTWRLILLQVLSLSAAASIISILFLQLPPGLQLLDGKIVDIVAGAVQHNADGTITAGSSELDQLRARSPQFWFVVADASGQSYAQGDVPEQYLALAGSLGSIGYIDIRAGGEPGSDLSAVLRTVETDRGQLKVLAGRGSYVDAAIVGVLFANIAIFPMLLILVVASSVIIPLAIGKAMRGLDKAEAEARTINFNNRGTRLSDEQVPTEIKGLVKAVNNALARLDNGYNLQQRFLSDAAHELKTPLTILQTRIESLPEGQLRVQLLRDIARLVALADQLLDLQRLAHEGIQLVPVDLVAMARQVVADMAPLAIAGGYELSLDVTVSHVWVKGDPGALERLLVNLIQNAITHAGNQGQIELTIDGRGTLEVLDSGPGIPLEHREKIFEPFYRVRPLSHGSGLGLNLSRDIVRRHGGDIVVFDSPAGGAGFRISLPPMVAPADPARGIRPPVMLG